MKPQPSVWIVILNWNGLEDTLACLESLSEIRRVTIAVHTLVIDNASDVDPREALYERFPTVEVVRSERNLGFAAGCNVGVERALAAGADYVLLLNNDTIVAPDFLEMLVAYAELRPEVGIVGPLICYADQPERVWFAGARIILALGYFEHRYLNRHRDIVPTHPVATDYVTGCCMLIATPVFRAIGQLDDKFFAYFEDADLCICARKFGFKVMFLPTSVIWHKESASTRRGLTEGTTSPLKHYLIARNRTVTVLRHGNTLEQSMFLLIGNTIILWYYFSAFLLRRRWKKMVWLVRGFVDGILQRFAHPGF